jgi:hypothetical protein
MQETANPSLRELKRETEQTRAGLTQTVEQLKATVSETASDLRQRISPEAIKAEVSDYVRSRGERMIEDITAAVGRNPMQAVAVGASIAYPLLRLARAIPLPVLMVGAGVFFAASKTGQSATQKASDLASDLSEESAVVATIYPIKSAHRSTPQGISLLMRSDVQAICYRTELIKSGGRQLQRAPN